MSKQKNFTQVLSTLSTNYTLISEKKIETIKN